MAENPIERLGDIPTYTPPGHSGTTNRRLVTAAEGRTFELIHGSLEPGGTAERHAHDNEYQAIYVLAGTARVILGAGRPVMCEAETVIRIPPGIEHEVTSMGSGPLELLIVYAPPISRGGTAAGAPASRRGE